MLCAHRIMTERMRSYSACFAVWDCMLGSFCPACLRDAMRSGCSTRAEEAH